MVRQVFNMFDLCSHINFHHCSHTHVSWSLKQNMHLTFNDQGNAGTHYAPMLAYTMPQYWHTLCPNAGTYYAPMLAHTMPQCWHILCPNDFPGNNCYPP